MSPSLLRFISAAGMNCCGGSGGRRMISTTAATGASSISPWLMLQPASGGADYKFYSLALNKVVALKQLPPPQPSTEGGLKLVGSSHGWLASFNPANNHVFLSNPISGRRMKLPDIETLPEFTAYPRAGLTVDKIILFASPSGNCVAVMKSPFGRMRLSLCRPTAAAWTPLIRDPGMGPDDMAFSSRHRRLYCISHVGYMESWDLSDPDSLNTYRDWRFQLDLGPDDTKCRRYLVFSDRSDRLFVVTRRIVDGRTVGFEVHVVDWKRKEVRCVDDGCLDGLAMFD